MQAVNRVVSFRRPTKIQPFSRRVLFPGNLMRVVGALRAPYPNAVEPNHLILPAAVQDRAKKNKCFYHSGMSLPLGATDSALKAAEINFLMRTLYGDLHIETGVRDLANIQVTRHGSNPLKTCFTTSQLKALSEPAYNALIAAHRQAVLMVREAARNSAKSLGITSNGKA
jgi:hypothetical protein